MTTQDIESEIVDYSQTTFTAEQKPVPAGVHTYLLALELNDVSNRGRFRWRMADGIIDPVSGLWAEDPLTREEQRKLITWHCDQLGGQMYVLHADPDNFWISVRAEIRIKINDNNLTQADYWPPYPDELKVLDEYKSSWNNEKMRQMPGVRYDYQNMPVEARHWRLCADKAACAWRVRDEVNNAPNGMPNNNLWEVQDYRGLCRGSRLRPTETHIFHDGPVEVDSYGVLHFR